MRTLALLALLGSLAIGQFVTTPSLITPNSIPTSVPNLNQDLYFTPVATPNVNLEIYSPFGATTYQVYFSPDTPALPAILTGSGALFINPAVPFTLIASGNLNSAGFVTAFSLPIGAGYPGLHFTLQAIIDDGAGNLVLTSGLELIWL